MVIRMSANKLEDYTEAEFLFFVKKYAAPSMLLKKNRLMLCWSLRI